MATLITLGAILLVGILALILGQTTFNADNIEVKKPFTALLFIGLVLAGYLITIL